MKYERLRTGVISALLAMVIAFGSMGVLVTGLSLKLSHGTATVAVCCAGAMLFALLHARRNGDVAVLCLLALAGGYLFYRGELIHQLKAMCQQISWRYDEVYHWGVLVFPENLDHVIYVDLPVAAWGLALEAVVTGTVTNRKSSIYGLVPGMAPLALCLVAPTTVPDLWALFALLGGAALLVMTGSVRRESAAQGNRLTLWIAIPVFAAVGLMFLIFPKGNYVNKSDEVTRYIAQKAMKLSSWLPENGEETLFSPQEPIRSSLNLTLLMGQDTQGIPVMQVQSENTGTVYLRGQAYDAYTGRDWKTTSRTEDFSGWGEVADHITVMTFAPNDFWYVPYFPGSGTVLTDGVLPNSGKKLERTWECYTMGSASEAGVLEQCLQLPDRVAAERLVPVNEGSVRDRAEMIGEYVRSSAVYDRKAPAMPVSENDFVRWFLNESDRGYCVHFATSAVVLLRGAGIPARYITGYKAETVAGEAVTVTTDDAHAWAEYYDADLGRWEVLEATPPDLSETEGMPQQQTVPSELPRPETVPPEPTQEQTVPTEPEQAKPELPDLRILLRILTWILSICGAVALVILQRLFRLNLRKRRQSRGTTNQRALALWQETEQLARLLKEAPPEQLTELAQKARFSQYTLESEELTPFMEYRRRSKRRLEKRPWYRRLLYRYFFAAI